MQQARSAFMLASGRTVLRLVEFGRPPQVVEADQIQEAGRQQQSPVAIKTN